MMRPRTMAVLVGGALLLLLAGGASGQERVEADVSAREIAIESTFTGVRLVIFGAVENSRQQTPGFYDVAIVIRGPEQDVVARRKERIFGIWINASSRSFKRVPGYYAVLSTRPLDELAPAALLDEHDIGFDALRFDEDVATAASNPHSREFRDALIRIKNKEGLFVSNPKGVEFLGSTLFRSTVFLPANVPVGQYETDIYLFHRGNLLGHTTSHFTLHKQGVELIVNVLAFDYPLLYGIAAVLIAVAAGLAASALFRRD